MSKTHFKENFYNYLDHLPPEKVKKYAKQFWGVEYPEHFSNEDEGYKILGKTCNVEGKVKRLKEKISCGYRFIEAYSDDDEEVLSHAEKGFLLEDGRLKPLENKTADKINAGG